MTAEELPGDVPECPRHPDLLAAGWVRRFLVSPDRVNESMAIYTEMGLEVRAEKLRPEDFGPARVGCSREICHEYLMIYTRAPRAGSR